ncbi:MAG: GAF domain-containing protein [Anaerolineales bacterium]
MSTIASTALQELLPITVSALISNLLIALGYIYLGFNLLVKEKGSENTWIQIILGDMSLFNKMLMGFGVVLIPAIAFLSFSSFSFFQTSLITSAQDNLQLLLRRESELITEKFVSDIDQVIELENANRTMLLLRESANNYSGREITEIQRSIQQFDARWAENDLLLISVTLDPVKNVELRNLVLRNPSIKRLILVDSYGGLITASEKPDKFNYTFDDWFINLKQSEDLRTFLGHAGWNDSLNSFTAQIGVALKDANGNFAGAILMDYDLVPILNSLSEDEVQQVGFGLATPHGEIFPASGRLEDLREFPTQALEPMPPEKSWRTFEFANASHLIQAEPLTNDALNFVSPWSVVAFQPVSQATAPLEFVQNTTLIIAVILLLTNSGIVILITQSITDPLMKLRSAAEQIQQGARGAIAKITSKDEFGALASSFNQMSGEIDQLITSMEDTITDRTSELQQRAAQLEASAVVAREAAGARDLITLLNSTVELVPQTFGYYHCGIFLLDAAGKYAVLQASNSEGGRRMLARGHKLQIGRVGVVGYCAGTGNPRIAQDVGADVTYYANPDMPETRSEMALPLIVRDQRIGVLDIQSTEPNAFDEEDIEILQVLADQLALAIDNTRLLEASQKALDELQVLYGQQTALAWRSRLAEDELAFAYDSTGMTHSTGLQMADTTDRAAHLSRPIQFRGQVIGELDFQRDETEGQWTEEETQLIEDILEQTALALENARLVQQIRLRSDQIRLLQEITAMAASILDEKQLLEQVAEKLRTSLEFRHCGIVLRETDPDRFKLVTSSTAEESDIKVGNVININEDPVTQMLVEKGENLVLTEASTAPLYQVFIQTFTTRKKFSLILLPLMSRDEVMGYILMEDPDENKALDAEENDLFNQISAQVSTAVESARLFTAEQQGRMSAAALLEITQIASASLDINRVLNQATTRSAQAIQAQRCSILLLDPREKIYPLVSIDNSGEAMEGEDWEHFQDAVDKTYKQTSIRTLAANLRQPLIINDLDNFTTLPLDWAVELETVSMMSIPLISQNKVIGTMIYTQTNPDKHFQENQIDLAQTIAGQIATTIENANLFEQAVTRAERERQIIEITAKIRSTNDPQQIMNTAISELRAALAESTIKAKQAAQSRKSKTNNGNESGNN